MILLKTTRNMYDQVLIQAAKPAILLTSATYIPPCKCRLLYWLCMEKALIFSFFIPAHNILRYVYPHSFNAAFTARISVLSNEPENKKSHLHIYYCFPYIHQSHFSRIDMPAHFHKTAKPPKLPDIFQNTGLLPSFRFPFF